MQPYKLILLLGTLGFGLMVSACDPTTPSEVNVSKLHVKDQVITDTLSTNAVDLKHVAVISRKVLRNGNGDVTLTIPYAQGGFVKAGDLGAAYKSAFAAKGVTHVTVQYVAMDDNQDTDHAVISFRGLVAKQAEDCGRIPGYQGTEDMDNFDGYQYGCETQANMAQMVADPADLMGQENASEANSRRNGAIIEPYMLGTPNQPIKGISASDVGK